jgi:hypothetical protein
MGRTHPVEAFRLVAEGILASGPHIVDQFGCDVAGRGHVGERTRDGCKQFRRSGPGPSEVNSLDHRVPA